MLLVCHISNIHHSYNRVIVIFVCRPCRKIRLEDRDVQYPAIFMCNYSLLPVGHVCYIGDRDQIRWYFENICKNLKYILSQISIIMSLQLLQTIFFKIWPFRCEISPFQRFFNQNSFRYGRLVNQTIRFHVANHGSEDRVKVRRIYKGLCYASIGIVHTAIYCIISKDYQRRHFLSKTDWYVLVLGSFGILMKTGFTSKIDSCKFSIVGLHWKFTWTQKGKPPLRA